MIKENFESVLEKLKAVTDRKVKVLAVTKKQNVSVMSEALKAGIKCWGENYVQEFVEKVNHFANQNVEWHFIGSLQTNKVKKVVPHVDLIHSVDRLSLVQEISKKSLSFDKVQNILLQVNVASEESKSGCEVSEAPQLIEKIQRLENIRLCGLMTMPPLYENAEDVRGDFSKLYNLSQNWQSLLSDGHHLKELSMGTSGDYIYAVQEGATIVRLGTVLLGARDYK